MDEKEIRETNKMIAKFMGYHYIPLTESRDTVPGWWKLGINPIAICFGKRMNHGNYLARSTNELYYDRDWEWLMEVCYKIEKLGYIINITSDCDNTETTIEESGYQWLTHAFVEDINKKRGVYKACAIFIEQYLAKTLKQATK